MNAGAVVVVGLCAVAFGFGAPPARRERPWLAVVLLGLGVSALDVGVGAAALGSGALAAPLIAAGLALLGVAMPVLRAWSAHGDDGEEDGSGGGGGPRVPQPPDGGPVLDWSAFDRERARWETVRPLAGSRT